MSRWAAIHFCSFLLSSDLAIMAFTMVIVSDCVLWELLLFLFNDRFMGSISGISNLDLGDSSVSLSSSDICCCWLGPDCSAVACGWLITNFSFTFKHRAGKMVQGHYLTKRHMAMTCHRNISVLLVHFGVMHRLSVVSFTKEQ